MRAIGRRYPPELAAYLAAAAPSRALALDLATAMARPPSILRIILIRCWRVMQVPGSLPSDRSPACFLPAAPSGASAGQVRQRNLIAVAQAAHWFDFDPLLRRGAARAASRRHGCAVDLRAISYRYRDRCGIAQFITRSWVPTGRPNVVSSRHATRRFLPLADSPAPPFEIALEWSLADVISYLGTWSAVGGYRSWRARTPLPQIMGSLEALWSAGTLKHVHWPLYLRTGCF